MDIETFLEVTWHGIIRTFTSDFETSNTREHDQSLALQIHRGVFSTNDEHQTLLEADYKTMYGKMEHKQAKNTQGSGSR